MGPARPKQVGCIYKKHMAQVSFGPRPESRPFTKSAPKRKVASFISTRVALTINSSNTLSAMVTSPLSLNHNLAFSAAKRRPRRLVSSLRVKCQMGSQTLLEFMSKSQDDDLTVLVTHLQCACKRIAAVVASPFGSDVGGTAFGIEGDGSAGKYGRDAPKPLDLVSVIEKK